MLELLLLLLVLLVVRTFRAVNLSYIVVIYTTYLCHHEHLDDSWCGIPDRI
jgi:hypothetical protein